MLERTIFERSDPSPTNASAITDPCRCKLDNEIVCGENRYDGSVLNKE